MLSIKGLQTVYCLTAFNFVRYTSQKDRIGLSMTLTEPGLPFTIHVTSCRLSLVGRKEKTEIAKSLIYSPLVIPFLVVRQCLSDWGKTRVFWTCISENTSWMPVTGYHMVQFSTHPSAGIRGRGTIN